MIPITAQNAIDSPAKLRESASATVMRSPRPSNRSSGTSSEYLSTTQTEVTATINGSAVRHVRRSIG
jgi:hypothetical protein